MAHLFNGQPVDWNCYNEGFNACRDDKQGNPYEHETREWYSWNKGWNAYCFETPTEKNLNSLVSNPPTLITVNY